MSSQVSPGLLLLLVFIGGILLMAIAPQVFSPEGIVGFCLVMIVILYVIISAMWKISVGLTDAVEKLWK